MQIYILKYGFFILNLKRILNSVDFSLAKLTQNDNGGFSLCAKARNDNALLSLQVDFFAAAAPCKSLGRYAQNDKCLRFLLWFAPRFCRALRRFSSAFRF